jgi:hypothetical protein
LALAHLGEYLALGPRLIARGDGPKPKALANGVGDAEILTDPFCGPPHRLRAQETLALDLRHPR